MFQLLELILPIKHGSLNYGCGREYEHYQPRQHENTDARKREVEGEGWASGYLGLSKRESQDTRETFQGGGEGGGEGHVSLLFRDTDAPRPHSLRNRTEGRQEEDRETEDFHPFPHQPFPFDFKYVHVLFD